MMLTAEESNSLPVFASTVATKPSCCGDARLGSVMPSSGEISRHIASRPACPTTRVSPAVFIAFVVPRFITISPSGYSHIPAARTLTTKSRSASVSGPNFVLATTRFWLPSALSRPSTAGKASAVRVRVIAPNRTTTPILLRDRRMVPPG
ncbi:hypothetical protein STENM36S_06530 [Streptomyces tendae]